jgi:hypothetical protein
MALRLVVVHLSTDGNGKFFRHGCAFNTYYDIPQSPQAATLRTV